MDNSAQDQLMRYLDNEMNGEERAAFEQKLEADKELFSDAENLNLARRAVQLYGTVRQVSQIHAEEVSAIRNTAPVIKMNPYRKILRYSIAAAASVVLIFFGAQYFNRPKPSADRLFAESYTRFEPTAMRGAAADTSAIEKAYLSHHDADVIGLFRSAGVPETEEMLMAGISCLETNRAPEAITILNSLVEKNTYTNLTAFNDEANYYLALALLKNKNYSEAAALMEKINADTTNPYSNKFPGSFTERVKKLQIQ